MAGSPRVLKPPTSRRRRHCWTHWNEGNGSAWG
jgi:hypothetical protein